MINRSRRAGSGSPHHRRRPTSEQRNTAPSSKADEQPAISDERAADHRAIVKGRRATSHIKSRPILPIKSNPIRPIIIIKVTAPSHDPRRTNVIQYYFTHLYDPDHQKQPLHIGYPTITIASPIPPIAENFQSKLYPILPRPSAENPNQSHPIHPKTLRIAIAILPNPSATTYKI